MKGIPVSPGTALSVMLVDHFSESTAVSMSLENSIIVKRS